ncbi:MAG: hypothetical protein IKV61_03450 [Clostridia bacterium]|nr:hypothetical protein [Clostridia bacterium]
MFSIFDLFNRVKTEDVYNKVKTKMLWWNSYGIPLNSNRNSDNYVVSPYNYCKKDKCGFAIKTKKDGLRLEFNFTYDKKEKECLFRIFVFDLDLSVSKNGMEMIRKKYSQFKFTFIGMTVVVFPARKCRTVMDCFNYLQDGMAAWNTSELYNLLVDLNKTLNK